MLFQFDVQGENADVIEKRAEEAAHRFAGERNYKITGIEVRPHTRTYEGVIGWTGEVSGWVDGGW
jgi:hypothetical protein